MANRLMTVFQTLDSAINGKWDKSTSLQPHVNSYDIKGGNDIIFKTDDKVKYAQTKLEMQQDAYLRDRWVKANADLSIQAFNGLNNLKLMYRDADLMDNFPEIGAALNIISEEAAMINDRGSVINIYSKSDRIKSILEDLFVNRLDIQTMAQMIIRGMCKYGNQFMLLNVDSKNGVMGWRQLPVYNVERLENGISNPYGTGAIALAQQSKSDKDLSTQFIWIDDNNGQVPFRNWQIGHFRLVHNSAFLPYGMSWLQPARRHWLMLSRMEDMMLMYRLDRSIERRVYKIFVGAIDDADVPAYVQQVANNFKRTPIIDPQTGQIDLRKNVLPVHKDTPIPLLDGRTVTIEELSREIENGKEDYVYSIQDSTHQIVPGKVVWCGKNYTAKQLYKITLDDGTYCIMAGEHEVIMRDGTKRRADSLVEGESVMPFYTEVKPKSKKLMERYHKVYNPHSGKYEFTHRMVALEVEKDNASFNTVRHKNFNKYDNNPTNLLWCDFHEHHKMHGDLARNMWRNNDKRKTIIAKLSEARKGNLLSDETKLKISESLKETFKDPKYDKIKKENAKRLSVWMKSDEGRDIHKLKVTKDTLRHRVKELGFTSFTEYKKSILKNHRILSIEIVDGDDVYCMTVLGLNGEDDRHNFALKTWNIDGSWCENGIFVANCTDSDIFIPTRTENAPTPIDTLSPAQNLTAMDDIKFVQNKVLAALQIPKSFINFEETTGDGKNLALMDVRFTRTINRIQQSFLMELNKIASIHLYLLGFTDDLTNFTLSMNNPSTQAEQLQIENLQKKIAAFRDAVSDPGTGIPAMSTQRALKEIMKWSDKEIQDNFEEIRLEKALAAELEKTSQIIKQTGIFDSVDRIYGEPGAKYQDEAAQGGEGGEDGGMPGGGGGAPMDMGGGDLGDLGDPGAEEGGAIGGAEGEMPMDMAGADMGAGGDMPMESLLTKKPLLLESERIRKAETSYKRADIYDKTLLINEEFDKMIHSLSDFSTIEE